MLERLSRDELYLIREARRKMTLSGAEAYLISLVRGKEHLNFTIEITNTKDETWHVRFTDRDFDGAIEVEGRGNIGEFDKAFDEMFERLVEADKQRNAARNAAAATTEM